MKNQNQPLFFHFAFPCRPFLKKSLVFLISSTFVSSAAFSTGNYDDGGRKRGQGASGKGRGGHYQDGPSRKGLRGGEPVGRRRGGRQNGSKDILRFCKKNRGKCQIKSSKISNGVRLELTSRDERIRKLLQALGARIMLDQEIKDLLGNEP